MPPDGATGKYAVETRDRQGRVVRYSQSNFDAHLARHPEMGGQLDGIAKTIQDPDVEVEADNGHNYYYRKGPALGKYLRLWLLAVVRYDRVGGAF